ncbi:methyltransferase domain-containing protein [Streptomyces sp. NPDC056930]|uniref:methyltransferase domain-containing protein n=1 Tax=Streptomyces sp. NPDC056930 TaxID=3345967 RepID=UPI0036402B45
MLDELELRPGHTVLDLGCGPGTDPGALAEAVTAAGEVIGVDHDRAAVDTAEQRTLGLELTTRRAVATRCFTEEGARSRLHHLSSCPFLAAMTLHIVRAES